MKFRLLLEDGKYNKLYFDFETLEELNVFLRDAMATSVRKLYASIEVITEEDEESEEEEC